MHAPPESRHTTDSRVCEVGWGDERIDGYSSPKKPLLLSSKCLLCFIGLGKEMQKRGREILLICLIKLYCEKKKAGFDLWPREICQQLCSCTFPHLKAKSTDLPNNVTHLAVVQDFFEDLGCLMGGPTKLSCLVGSLVGLYFDMLGLFVPWFK